MLGLGRELADRHVFDHAPAQRAHCLVGHGDAPVLVKAANPSSQDRTPCRAILSTVPHTTLLRRQLENDPMIRRAYVSDIPQVAALYHAVWHETHAPFMPRAEIIRRSTEFFMERMTALLQSTLVTELNEEIVAFSAWRGHILGQLYVAMPHRGTQAASRLLTASEIEMAKEGVTESELHCLVGNERARRFYERMGWHNKEKITEPVAGEHGQTDVPFWCMTKLLAI
nr:GNAT family N-acetyltransferase [Bradyrhizobium campsiandrae]